MDREEFKAAIIELRTRFENNEGKVLQLRPGGTIDKLLSLIENSHADLDARLQQLERASQK